MIKVPSIAFVIIATELQPWKRILQEGQESTWIKGLNGEEHYLAAYSNNALNKSIQDPQDHRRIIFQDGERKHWQLSDPEFIRENHASFEAYGGFGGLVPTTISAMNFLSKTYNPDFIIRTNVSSYWNIAQLRKLLSQLSTTDLYAGVTGPAYSGISGKFKSARYVSGAGMILSRDVVSRLVDIRDSIDLTLIDDLTIGRSLAKVGVKPTELGRIDVRHKWDIKAIDEEVFRKAHHFRCKSEHRFGGSSFRSDVSLMRSIDKRINLYDE